MEEEKVLADRTMNAIPEYGSVWLKGNVYRVASCEWHIDGDPFETGDTTFYTPYVIVRLL